MLEFLNGFFSNENTDLWHSIEIALISFVIIFQLVFTIIIARQIKTFKNIFSSGLFLKNAYIEKNNIGKVGINDLSKIHFEDAIDLNEESITKASKTEMVKLSLVESNGKNDVIKGIRYGINTYLISNYGAVVNFSIIKDIIDREVNIKDEEITQSVALPLYLGLAATMIGIIFGLFSMPSLDGDGFSIGINALIDGVKIAMIGSLVGLICTTFLSSFVYKSAKRKLQKGQNNQITYLQAKLLPELLKAEDTGVSGLKASLDRFARVATLISDNVLDAAHKTGKNLDIQRKLMNKVNEMEVLKVSKFNLDLFNKMDASMKHIDGFSNYLNNLERITTQLSNFSNRTEDINKLISSIDNNLNDSKELMRFLTSHFEKIEGSGNQVLNAVGLADSHFEDSIRKLRETTDASIEQLYKNSGAHESKLEDIYKKINDNLSEITTKYVNAFKEAYSQSIPKFEQLDKLSGIDDIQVYVRTIAESQNIIDKLSNIENKLESNTKQQSYDDRIFSKLDEISGKLNQTVYTKKEGKAKSPKKTKTPIEKEVSIGKVFKELFKRNGSK